MNTNFTLSTAYGGVTFRYSRGRSLAEGRELHPYHEILYYLDGDAGFLSANLSCQPEKGTLFIIPKEYFHNFPIGDQESYTRLTISFGESSVDNSVVDRLSELRAITPDEKLRALLDAMCTRMESGRNDPSLPIFMYGAFLLLLSSLPEADNPAAKDVGHSDISECVAFIDAHFSEELTLSRLCSVMHISESALNRLFKSRLGITPHRYIAERRLIYANRLIAEGAKATDAAALCGYSDYSAFYKAYLKKFGIPPYAEENRRRT